MGKVDLALIQVDAVAEQRARPEQAVAAVDLGVALGPGEELACGGDLAVVLAQVGLDVGFGMLAGEGARGLELGVGRGEREARGDGVELAAASVPALEQRLALALALLGRVEQARRRTAVHHHLAGDHARVAALALGEEGLHRFRPHGAVDHGRGGAVAQQLVEKEPRRGGGMI